MRKSFLCLLIWLLVAHLAWGQTERPNPLLTSKDSILLIVEGGKKFIFHPVKAKHTLFSISRYYQVGLEELFDHNPDFRNDPSLKAGTRIKIPIPNKAIKRYKSSTFVASKNISIYYVVQPGDNLYQIAKRYFEMPVDSVLKRNKLKSNSLKPGQRLHMGWIGIEGIHPEWRAAKPSPESEALKVHFQEDKKGRKEVAGQGVCYWPKDSKEKGSLYALHREAVIGTVIQVNNPMNNRSVYAKVIGRIPTGYERNVEVVLSPEAALKLGARDPRFFVKTKYLK